MDTRAPGGRRRPVPARGHRRRRRRRPVEPGGRLARRVTGDFNGDGLTDVAAMTAAAPGASAWRTPTGYLTDRSRIWNPAAGWNNVKVADFNGDGKADIVGRTPWGDWWVGPSNGTSFTTRSGATGTPRPTGPTSSSPTSTATARPTSSAGPRGATGGSARAPARRSPATLGHLEPRGRLDRRPGRRLQRRRQGRHRRVHLVGRLVGGARAPARPSPPPSGRTGTRGAAGPTSWSATSTATARPTSPAGRRGATGGSASTGRRSPPAWGRVGPVEGLEPRRRRRPERRHDDRPRGRTSDGYWFLATSDTTKLDTRIISFWSPA